MAPEQATGGTLSKQTDMYSLGLVLYELFTGKRALEANSLDELARLHQSTPTSPATNVTDLDPAVEHAILRCLEPVPANRPPSAAALAAALPCGDPLAMAVAAGETPSPEMVAGAGGSGTLRPAVAAACLVAILAGLAGAWFFQAQTSRFGHVPLPLSPVELRAAARAAVAELGYAEPPVDTASGFGWSTEYVEHVTSLDRSWWDEIATAVPPPAYFWYRESPAPLVPENEIGRTGSFDPPMTRAGMTFLRLAPTGAVWLFRAVAPDRASSSGPWPEPDWGQLFALADLDIDEFESTDPIWAPPTASDTRVAWLDGNAGTLRIEAAAFRGRPVWFEVIPAWRLVDDGVPAGPAIGARLTGFGLSLFVLVGAGVLARRNYRLRRADPRRAARLALLVVGLGTAAAILTTSSSASTFLGVWVNNLAMRTMEGAIAWLFYMAIEPYVRRLWPDTLIAWSRMLEGRLRDPMVGRHLLFGALAGLAISAIQFMPNAAPWFGLPPPEPFGGFGGLVALGGFSQTVGVYFTIARQSFAAPVGILLVILLFRVVFRKPWLAYLAFVSMLVLAVYRFSSGSPSPNGLAVILIQSLNVVILTQLGLFAGLRRFSDSPCTAWARRGTSACTNAGGPMQAYSMDLRERALLDSDAGMKAADVAVKYRVSGSWVRLLKQRRRETGEVAPRVQRHGRRRMLEPHLHTLAALIAEQPDRTLAELKDALGTPASLATIWRAVAALDVTVKKNGPALRTRST